MCEMQYITHFNPNHRCIQLKFMWCSCESCTQLSNHIPHICLCKILKQITIAWCGFNALFLWTRYEFSKRKTFLVNTQCNAVYCICSVQYDSDAFRERKRKEFNLLNRTCNCLNELRIERKKQLFFLSSFSIAQTVSRSKSTCSYNI